MSTVRPQHPRQAGVSGGRVGVAVVADAVDTVATFRNEAISGASVAVVEELACCGFRAVALVQGQ
jgi:hypothetical protein